MTLRSKNLFILLTVLIIGWIFLMLAEHYFTIDRENLIACPEEAVEPCDDELVVNDQEPNQVACTADAKMCPDGSFVGRSGPNCEFDTCPKTKPVAVVSSFEDCVAAGNPVMESYPRQCIHEGEHFVEEISEPISVFPIRYGEDASRIDEYQQDCVERGGSFNACGSACPPDAEMCMDVCSMICETPKTVVCSPEQREQICTKEYVPVCALVEVQCITTPCEPVEQTFGNSCSACSEQNVISYQQGACEQAM